MKHLQERLTHYFKLIQLIFDIVKLTYSNSKCSTKILKRTSRFLQSATAIEIRNFFLVKHLLFEKFIGYIFKILKKRQKCELKSIFEQFV